MHLARNNKILKKTSAWLSERQVREQAVDNADSHLLYRPVVEPPLESRLQACSKAAGNHRRICGFQHILLVSQASKLSSLDETDRGAARRGGGRGHQG